MLQARRSSLISTVTCCLLLLYGAGVAHSQLVGQALMLRDHVVVLDKFKNFPTDQMTFEAWISTTDDCHRGTIMSYALDSSSTDEHQRVTDFNHFVIFDTKNVIACHDFEYLDLVPDWDKSSCHSAFNKSTTGTVVSRTGEWKHLAVTWDGKNNGHTKIYINGLLVAEAVKENNGRMLQAGGAFMLGGEQDCFGGCTDAHQGFYGAMDEVRIWNVVRSQADILRHMRAQNVEQEDHLVAYWKFDDPGEGTNMRLAVAKDASKHGNDLQLIAPPSSSRKTIERDGNRFDADVLTFKNNYAMADNIENMPEKDITVEFWARAQSKDSGAEGYAEFISFASIQPGDGDVGNDHSHADAVMLDDAVRIYRYMIEERHSRRFHSDMSTLGSTAVHINSNRQGNGLLNDHWIFFDTKWLDDQWHHVAVTWQHPSGTIHLYFDGEDAKPFWVTSKGWMTDSSHGVTNVVAADTQRSARGALVFGQNQECFGGCFSPATALKGEMAAVRFWNVVRSKQQVKDEMYKEVPSDSNGLVMMWDFNARRDGEAQYIEAKQGGNRMVLGSDAPMFVHSTVPLAADDGSPLRRTPRNVSGFALALHDQQTLLMDGFENFPADALTVEFWMLSTDTCRRGTPFSYAHGAYEQLDNAFLIFNYNDFGISVMEDEGTLMDHGSGWSATDGVWHHIAVTWSSRDGAARLYDNGRLTWTVQRGKGKRIPSGGTLVIGREQDCSGGCFDSASGAEGNLDPTFSQEYGAQDFYGLIDDIRVWNRVLTQEELQSNIKHDSGTVDGAKGGEWGSAVQRGVDPKSNGLIAYWNFNEGGGYIVHDVTGNGHDLYLTRGAWWHPVPGLTVCGDGIVAGGEECDDGDTDDGDGCSHDCKVESGWTCSNGVGAPSKCRRSSSGTPTQPPGDPSSPAGQSTHNPSAPPHPSSSTVPNIPDHSTAADSSGTDARGNKARSSGWGKAALIVLVVVLCCAVFVGSLYVARHTIFEHFPQVRRGVEAAQDRLTWLVGKPRRDYSIMELTAEQFPPPRAGDDSFTTSQRMHGPYHSLPTSPPDHPNNIPPAAPAEQP